MKRLLAACVLASTLSVTGCAQLFAGGLVAIQGLLPVSDEQEVAMGAAAVQEIFSDPAAKLYRDPTVNAYVSRIGARVVKQSSRPNLPWQFYVLDSPEQNAFALPGGFLFITTGALAAMQNEAQLAGVLGHEAGHVAARHGVNQVKRAMLAQGLLISTLGSSPQAAQVAGRIATELVLRGYGRDAELEADRLGVVYAAKENYDPHQLEAFLRILAQHGEAPRWLAPLATHPNVDERVAVIERTINERKLKGNLVDRESFMAATAPLQGGGAGPRPR